MHGHTIQLATSKRRKKTASNIIKVGEFERNTKSGYYMYATCYVLLHVTTCMQVIMGYIKYKLFIVENIIHIYLYKKSKKLTSHQGL